MAGQNGGRGGKGKSPRYSDRYGANRPNPYTGYLPPGAAPAGQIYHPESVNMEKVSQMMTENAANLAAAAASRAAEDAEVKGTMDNENTTSTAPAEEPAGNSQQGESQNGGRAQQRSRSKHRKNGSSGQNTQRGMSEEQRQKLQSIQEEAAAEMVAEVLSESIMGAAENGSRTGSSAESAEPKAARTAKKSEDEDTDWSNMRITTKFRRGGAKRGETPFDPDRFDEAEVRENPFDANYFTADDSSARFVPPLEIFDTESDDQPEGAAAQETETQDDSDDVILTGDAAQEEADESSLPEDSEAEEEAENAQEDDTFDEAADEVEEDTADEIDFDADSSDSGEEEASDEEDQAGSEDESEPEEPENGDEYADGEEPDVADASSDDDETDDYSQDDAEDGEPDDDEDDDGFNGVDWETPDESYDEDDDGEETDDEDADMIIVDDVRSDITGKTMMPAAERDHSILRVSGESYAPDESEEDQDDTLFIKQERVSGGTEVFNLPEGVKLPTYIDDDEFLEQWLNEGEDMAIKDKRRRRRVSTIIGALTMIFAMVGFVWVIQYAFGAIAGIGNTDQTKDKYTDFISPVVMSEVQPFESWSAIPAEKLLQSAIFHVLTNMEESYYETDDTNKIVIPSGDIADAVKELYGDEAILGADSLDILDSDDVYYSDTDDCFHVAATGISGPQPEIISISKKGSEVTLTVGYLDETGLAATDGYYLTMQYILVADGDDLCIKAIRSVETTD